MQKILIVEDDCEINNMIKEFLEEHGYICTQAFSGTECQLLTRTESYDLILLDLMLPGTSGESLIQDLAKTSKVIVLSAKHGIESKVNLLELGANDYICKPFDIDELLARVKVQLRQQEPKQRQLTYKDWTIDLDLMTLNVAGELIDLTAREFKIIELLMHYPQKVFTKEYIYEYVWEDEYIIGDKTIHVHMSNIRTKLKPTGTDGYIQTVWGMGFKLIE
ncbi:MAG: response regulator transcription factor [Coprobacillus sp.]